MLSLKDEIWNHYHFCAACGVDGEIISPTAHTICIVYEWLDLNGVTL